MLVTQDTINAIYEIVGESFKCNRFIDRCVSVLGVKYCYNNTASLIHLNIAHAFPLWADKFGEILEDYNIPVEYAITPEGKQDYSSGQEIIAAICDTCTDYQSMVMGVAKVAFENNDIHVYAEILDILKEINKIVAQMILLKDKANAYGERAMTYDAHIKEHFWTLG